MVSKNFKPAMKSKPGEDDLEGQKVRLIRSLLDTLPDLVRAQLVREIIGETATEKSSPTDVISNVLRLFPAGHTITAAELREQVESRGIQAEPKEVYNAIGYLARTGALRRVGYGRYVVDGVEISTSDDFGGEQDRHEDLSDGD